MATVKPLDPIQGFVDYINDIKPYHTKIAEVLIEYQQVDLVDVTIIEDLRFVVDMFRPDDRVNDGIVCDNGYDTFPYGGTSGDTVTNIDGTANTFTVPGNRADVYVPGSEISVFSQHIMKALFILIAGQDETDYDGVGNNGTFVGGNGFVGSPYAPADTITLSDGSVITVDAVDGNFDVTDFTVTTSSGTTVSTGVTLTQTSTSGSGLDFTLTPESNNVTPGPLIVIDPDGDHTGIFTVLSSTFVPGVNPFTIITVVEDIVDPPILGTDEFYLVEIQPAPIDIIDEIPYSNIDNRPFEEPDENQLTDIGANAFVIDGPADYTSRFTQGVRFKVNTGKNVGTYTTLYSDFVGGQTRIRVIKDVKHISSIKGTPGGGQIREPNLGYEPVATFCDPVHPETVQAVPIDSFVVDSVAFEWGSTYFFDIIAVDDVLETVLLDGDFSSILFPGDEVFIVGSDVNDGTYNIVSVTLNMITNETTVELDGDLDPSVTLGQLRIDLADIVDFFQYSIVDTNPMEFIVYGNATADLFPSQQFRVIGNGVNDGMYTAIIVQYDGTHSIIEVADTLVADVPGGVVESHRDQGARLDFRDDLRVTVVEEEVTALVASGLTYGGWDADYWDVGAYDENLGALINLYGGTF